MKDQKALLLPAKALSLGLGEVLTDESLTFKRSSAVSASF